MPRGSWRTCPSPAPLGQGANTSSALSSRLPKVENSRVRWSGPACRLILRGLADCDPQPSASPRPHWSGYGGCGDETGQDAHRRGDHQGARGYPTRPGGPGRRRVAATARAPRPRCPPLPRYRGRGAAEQSRRHSRRAFGRCSWPHVAGQRRPDRASSTFFWAQRGGIRTRHSVPGRAVVPGGNRPAGWGTRPGKRPPCIR